VQFFCEPDCDGLVDNQIGGICMIGVMFGDDQRLVFHKIASKELYVTVCRDMKEQTNKMPSFNLGNL